MYLKSLEVHGFKSFANKLVFEFHHGITAIVGPNGSGKSNVADAVRWVLGEQSAKQLRGAKMEDVIFAGTELRKPLGFAYVAITINNEDHKLNVPYEEVKIARRVYRSGESEYLLNGAPCRLRDVQELLFDTGIGKEGYSIIGQGQIDKILSGKPEERRELFDEAAGIVKYKKRKAAAEKNLEEEKNNLVRVEDILSELTKQVGPLEKQAEKAKEFLKYRDELRSLDVNMFLKEYENINNQISEVEKKQVIASEDLKRATEELEKSKEEYEAKEKELDEHTQLLEEHKEELSSEKLKQGRYESDIRLLNEQINTIRQNEEHYNEQTELLKKKLVSLKEDIEKYDNQKKDNELKKEKIISEQSINSEMSKETALRIADIEKNIALCENKKLAAINEASDIKTEEQKYRTLLEQNNIKKAELTQRILKNKSEASAFTETIDKEKKILLDLSDKINAMNDINAELSDTIHKINNSNDELGKEERDLQQKFHMENSRLNSLKNMTERYEGFGQSIKRVMERKSDTKGIIGVVADIISVKKEYELAVETALGGSIQNIVTDNEQTAKSMIEYLKKNRYGRATFLPLTNIHAKPASNAHNIMSEPGVIGIASSLVEAEDRFSDLVEYLLGRFIVVDNIDNAIAIGKKYHHTVRMVTIEGDLLNPGGSMSGGAFKNNNNLLGRRREMEELETQVAKLRLRLNEVNDIIAENDKKKNEIMSKVSDNNKIRQELIIKQNTAKLNYNRAVSDLEKNQEELERIRFEGQEIENSKSQLMLEINKIESTLSNNEDQSKSFDDEIASYQKELEAEKNKEEEIAEKNSKLMLEQNSLDNNEQFILENIKRINDEINRNNEELQEVYESSSNVDKSIKDKQSEIEDVNNKISSSRIRIEELSAQIEKETEKKTELTKENKGFMDKREELSKQINEFDKECFRLNNQKEKLAERIDSYTSYMWEQYELTYHSAEEIKTDMGISENEMRSRIKELKSMIKNLGDVNVNAIEQYKDVNERFELLSTQHDDIIKAAEVLEGVIEELDVEMRKQFEEQFAEIKSRFDNVFKELFGGGRGTLELTDDEDILLAGIKIVAQPPGKKLQNMMQLSGGEKALTAIALLFAIQSLKPSPFCLLDEIEAALDDSNVGRYADYLHKLTKDTQFIVITHRRGTMNAADILYGITMQEKGVSTLVSVNLLDEKEIAN